MVRTIRKTSQLIKALAWEIIFKINSPLTIVSQVIGWIKTQVVKPLPKVFAQQFKTLLPFTFFYEVFNFHLFKLTYAEKKFTWCNFVSKGFTDLRNTKWNFWRHGVNYVLEVYKNTLSCFGTEIYKTFWTGHSTNTRLKHHIKLTSF